MLNNPKIQTFLENYFKMADANEALLFLKDFMFSLSKEELMDFMLDTGKAHNEAIKQHLADSTCTEQEKEVFKKQFEKLLTIFAQPSIFSKAA